MKSKLKFLFQRIPLLLSVVAAVMLFEPIEAKALTAEEKAIVAAITGTDGSTVGVSTGIRNGIDDMRTGYIAYILDESGADVGLPAYGFCSPSYESTKIGGSIWIAKSRRGHSITEFKDVAPWNVAPFSDSGGSNQGQIKSWMTQRQGEVLNSVIFIKDNWDYNTAEKFKNGEYVLVLETVLNFQYGYPSSESSYRKETATSIQLEYPGLTPESAKAIAEAINAINQLKAQSGYETKGSPIIGTIVNCIDYYNNTISPMGNYFKRYTHGIAAFTMRVDRNIAGFQMYTGAVSASTRFTDGQIQSYGLGTAVFRCVDASQTTYDESQGETPAPPADESDGKFTIIKSYRKKIGETKYEDEGTFHIKEVAPEITIENEKSHKVVEWRISTTENTGISSLTWESSVPPSVSDTGKNPTTVKLKDPEKVLYVLLERTEEEPPEPADHHYLISESTITRRVKMSEPDNQLSMPDILNHTFKWVLPAHKTTCSSHTWTAPCDGSHTRPVKVSDGCPDNCTKDQIDPTHQHQGAQYDTQNYNCGQNCKTQTAYCSGWDWKNKDLKLSLHNINQQSSPNILAIKTSPKNWFYNPNTNISKLIQGFYRDNNTFDREAPSQQIYENKNWDYICVIHRGQDKLNLAAWINGGEGQYDKTEATTNLQGVNNEVYQASNQSSGKRKQNGFYTDTFQVSIGRQEHGVEQTDNETIYRPTTPSSVPGQSLLSSSAICPDDQRRATLTPLSFNVIVRVEVYKGLETTDKHDGFEDGHTSKPRGDYRIVSGRMIKGSNISFIPYILMKYDTIDEAITDAPAYVMGEHTRDMSLLHYGEIAWNKSSNPNNLTLTSAQWSTHATATKWLADKNIQDKNSVLPGGATHSLSIKKDDRRTVTVTTYQSIIVGLGEKHVTNTTGGQIPDDLTIPTAQSEHTSFVASVVDALDQTVIQQYVNKNPDKDPEDGIAVNPSTSIDSLHGSSNRTASTESKYYFRNDGEGATAGQGDFDVRELGTDTRIYTYYTTVDGRIMSADTTANPGVFKSGEGTLAESASWTALIEPRLHIVAKLKAALEDHTGNDDTALTGTNWYNEAFDGISVIVQDTQLEVGFIDPTERTQVLDPKLIPDTLGSKSNGTTAIKDLFHNLKR